MNSHTNLFDDFQRPGVKEGDNLLIWDLNTEPLRYVWVRKGSSFNKDEYRVVFIRVSSLLPRFVKKGEREPEESQCRLRERVKEGSQDRM